MVQHVVEDDVVTLLAAGEVLLRVVDDLIRTEGPEQLEVPGAAHAGDVSTETHPRELDMLLTAGERISMALCAMAIQDLGVDAMSLTGSQAGILTTPVHGRAEIIDIRTDRVRAALGKPTSSGCPAPGVQGESGGWDRYDNPHHRVHFSYSEDGGLDLIMLMLARAKSRKGPKAR